MGEEKKINILVVEDEIPLMEAIKTKLGISGFEVVTARTAEQAFDYLESMDIKVLWLDHYLLGKENGLDIVSKVKNSDKYRNIPIFVVSNTASSDKVQSYINFGVSKYYVKSDVRLDKIVNDIKEYLEKPE
ncbi:MAG: response regulator [Patescibacteria group bacterium]|jgi:two-component system chemotaxis sensor kinase CheA|nr:response regulator [Patescibacteria group bacterium]